MYKVGLWESTVYKRGIWTSTVFVQTKFISKSGFSSAVYKHSVQARLCKHCIFPSAVFFQALYFFPSPVFVQAQFLYNRSILANAVFLQGRFSKRSVEAQYARPACKHRVQARLCEHCFFPSATFFQALYFFS